MSNLLGLAGNSRHNSAMSNGAAVNVNNGTETQKLNTTQKTGSLNFKQPLAGSKTHTHYDASARPSISNGRSRP